MSQKIVVSSAGIRLNDQLFIPANRIFDGFKTEQQWHTYLGKIGAVSEAKEFQILTPLPGRPGAHISSEGKFQGKDLQLALDFADSHENFDDAFLQSLAKQFEERGYLTDKQYSALQNIMDTWHMHEWEAN